MANVWEYRFLRGTPQRWADQNPILGPAEPGVEIGSGQFKLGDGVTPWNDLPYFLNENGVVALIQGMAGSGDGSGPDPRIGNMSDLTTDDKTLIVSAINELNNEGIDFVVLYENAKAG